MRRAIALLALAAADCGPRGPVDDNRGVSANQIERLATLKVEHPDRQAPARPQPLTLADLASARMTEPACDFTRDGRMLLAVSAVDAVARVAGSLRHFAHASPAGPTGGFFEDRQVSISVGRIGEVAPGEGVGGSWPGRITVTNRRAEAQVELDGIWRCGT